MKWPVVLKVPLLQHSGCCKWLLAVKVRWSVFRPLHIQQFHRLVQIYNATLWSEMRPWNLSRTTDQMVEDFDGVVFMDDVQRMTSKEDVKHLCLYLQQVPPVHLWQKCCCRDKTTGTYKQSVPNHCHKLHWGLIECCLVCERFATFPVINKSLQTHWTGKLCRLLKVKLMKNSRKLTWSCPYQRSGMETIVDPELQAVPTMKRMDGQTQSSNLL